MKYTFFDTGHDVSNFNIVGLNDLDTSKVTNMSSMFAYAGRSATTFNIGNLGSWDVSSVTDMSYMFFKSGYSATYTLDLSGWNVSSVTSYSDFNAGVESKVTAPTWVN